MTIIFKTTFQVRVLTEDMFGEMQEHIVLIKADDIDELTESVFDQFGELEYEILNSRTYAEPFLS